MERKPGLIRALGIWGACAVVVGTTIGSGVFIVANKMTAGMGTPGGVFFVWVFGGLLSLSGALAYAELAAMMPEAGGEYVYLREAYGPLWGFLYGWMEFLVAKPGSLATLGAGFAIFFGFFFPAFNARLVAFTIIVILGIVNYFGVRAAGFVQTIFTVLKIALIVGVAAAAFMSGKGNWGNLSTSVPVGNALGGFVTALVGALWAYDGWNNISMVAGEVDRPQRNLPLSLIAGTMVIGSLYLLANLGYFYVLSAPEVAASKGVAADAARRFLGDAGGAAVAFAAMVSIFAAINGSILSGSRIPFAMAADGLFFSKLAELHPRFHGPSASVVALCGWGAVISLTGRYDQLYTFVIFASWIFYGMAGATVFALRRKHPEWHRPHRAWGYPVLPAVFVLVAAALSLSILRENPQESLIGLVIIAAGIPAYYFWSKKKAAASGGVFLVLLALSVPQADAHPTVLVFTLNDAAGQRSLAENAGCIQILSPQSFVAHKDGKLTGSINPAILAGARKAGLALSPAVVNKDFSTPDVEALLDSPRARARLTRALTDTARRFHLRGFVIDFESLGRRRREQYVKFLEETGKQFHKAKLILTVAVPPPVGINRENLDYQKIARIADRVILMAYDQHPRFGPPGPIAAYPWVENGLAELLAMAPPEKVLLGLAFYHRDWGELEARTGSYAQALALLRNGGGELQWDEAARSPWFSIERQGQIHTVWMEDSRSIAEKVGLARKLGLAGVAAWRLGQEDPAVWPVIEEYAKGKR